MPPSPSAKFTKTDIHKFIILGLLGLFYSMAVAYVISIVPDQQYRDDFYPRWYASQQLIQNGRSLYDPQNTLDLFVITPWTEANQSFYYPAYTFFLTGPLSLLPYVPARILWTVLGMWLVWLSILILAYTGDQPSLSVNRMTGLLVLVTLSVPFFQHIVHAQFNGIGLFALALVYRQLYRQRYFLAGLLAAGLLFKPQTMLLPIAVLLIWTLFKPERRIFWLGLGAMSFLFWLGAELFERQWVSKLLNSLNTYSEITPVLAWLMLPNWLTRAILLALTGWFVAKNRNCSAQSPAFLGLLVWVICLNALLVPIYGMLHMVVIGALVVMLFNAYLPINKLYAEWVWWASIGLIVVSLMSFIVLLLLVGPSGLHITIAELFYREAIPIAAALAAIPLLVKQHKLS